MKLNIKLDSAIAVLKKNRDEHVIELKESTDVWLTQVFVALEQLRDAVDRKGLKASNEALTNLFYRRPVDSRLMYSKYLGGLERAKADGQEIVELDEDDYDRIFNDNWEWRIQSKTSNAAYKK
jgi:hypothetical protein